MSVKDYFWGCCLRRMKRWTRAGLLQEVTAEIGELSQPTVVSIGGYGPVDDCIKQLVLELEGNFISFDIEPLHSPDIIGDIVELSSILSSRKIIPDFIIALEVLEHVADFSSAIENCYRALQSDGKLILSTPWIIPIHDRPRDYYRFTPELLKLKLSSFSSFTIFARGNFYDSVIALMLRGLFSGGSFGKVVMLGGIFLSYLTPRPRIYKEIDNIDSCIGYLITAVK